MAYHFTTTFIHKCHIRPSLYGLPCHGRACGGGFTSSGELSLRTRILRSPNTAALSDILGALVTFSVISHLGVCQLFGMASYPQTGRDSAPYAVTHISYWDRAYSGFSGYSLSFLFQNILPQHAKLNPLFSKVHHQSDIK